jgi:uncharacterized protein YdeI (YjbR/CyaY-like superfamily)
MPRTDPRIDDYIAKSAPFAQPILRHLRSLVHQAVPGVEETWKWSSPFFAYNGKILCNMAAFKAHAVFGFWHQQMRAELEKNADKSESAMGHYGRLASLDDLPADKVILGHLKRAAALNESDIPANPRPKAPAKPEAKVPDDLAAALKKNKTAAANFAAFSPSARREYISWIVEAKREETRASRVATTVEWVAEGKQRNWKYM